MRYIIQTIGGQILHDFSFTLLTSIRYQNWKAKIQEFSYILTDKEHAEHIEGAIPCGSVEFVSNYLTDYYHPPVPRNVPLELIPEEFSQRRIINGDRTDIFSYPKFVKSNEHIKGFASVAHSHHEIPDNAQYQISDVIDIDSEWRAFVYHNKLVGLQNYTGDFTMFPDVPQIERMIKAFEPSAPVAYTLDVGVNSKGTFVVEVHDFFSCGLYGFADHRIYPFMLARWFNEFIKKQ